MAHDAASVVDAVREQHEADLLTLKREYASKLESFAGEILDHYLSGESWETAFAAFFAEHCHKFAQFSPDDGFELRMTEVHNAFLQMMDGLLDAQLVRLELSADRCLELLSGSPFRRPSAKGGGASPSGLT